MRQFKFNPTPEPLTVINGGLSTPKAGRPRKQSDAVAQEKVADIDKLRSLGINFSKNLMKNTIEFVGTNGRT